VAEPATRDKSIGSRPLKIVHVLRAPVGGLFRHVRDLAGEQVARGHQVGLIVDALTGGARAVEQLAALEPGLALGVLRLPMHRPPHIGDLSALLAVTRRLAALEPDVVHGHGSKGGLFARLAPSSGVRAYTPHGGSLNYNPGSLEHRVFMLAERILGRRTDVLLFESAFIAGRYEHFVGKPRRLARVVRNGIAPEEFEPVALNDDAAELLYVGEFRFAKGLDTLIEALGLLKRTAQLTPRLILVGDGPEKHALGPRAEAAGVGAQLLIKPPMSARDAFAKGRILVVPSRFESLPYIVLEAVGAHKPIVATRVGGMAEIFGAYADRLIPSGDAQELAMALKYALEEHPILQSARSAQLAAQAATRFSLQGMVDGIMDGYLAAMAARNRA
jgi:glycosyltransferase involved in cell wall biosynthesis